MDKNVILLENIQKKLNDKEIINEIENVKQNIIKQNKRMHRIVSQSDTEQHRILNLSEELENRNRKIKDLLNNADQGFLSFNDTLLIDKEYSKKAYDIFGCDIAGYNIASLLYPNDKEKQEFFSNTLKYILNENPIKQEILISLLDKEFKINNKFIQIDYKIVQENKYMLILTDITEKKALDEAIKQEQLKLKMIVNVVTSKEQSIEILLSFNNFVLNIDEYKNLDKLDKLKMEFHTFKGLFAQKEFYYIVNFLHYLEDLIQSSKKNNKIDEKILNLTKDDLLNELQKDLNIIENILGKDFLQNKNLIEIDKDRIFKIIDQMEHNYHIDEKILSKLKELTYPNIKVFLNPYKKLIDQLSKRFEKEIDYHFEIEDIYIPTTIEPFLNTLVHIFRNTIDHGIETLEERLESGKSAKANIWCNVYRKNNNIYIFIKDDGRGIDIEKIKNIAIEKKLYLKEELEKKSEEELLNIILDDGFSSKEIISDISGLGIGLYSIKEEIDKLNGSMKIINKVGEGIEFNFKVPLFEQFNINKISNEILDLLIAKTKEYIKNSLNINFRNIDIIKNSYQNLPNDINVCINLNGDFNAVIYMGIDKELTKLFLEKFLYDTEDISQFSKLELEEAYFEMISEILNINLGNILQDISIIKDGYKLDISTPYILEKDSKIKDGKSIFYDILLDNNKIVLGILVK